MKKISVLLLIAILCLTLSSCAKVISEESVEVEAIITDTDYDPPYTTTRMIHSGKVMIPQVIHHPADYDIFLEYEGVTLEWDTDEDTFKQYENKIGDTIKCYLIIRTYDDGTIKKELQVIKGE